MGNETKEIIVRDQKISYILRRSRRARRLRLTVYSDGSAVLTSPIGLSEKIAEKFLHEKAQWLISKLKFFSRKRLRENRGDGGGGDENSERPGQRMQQIPRLTRRDYLRFKPQALALVLQKVVQINAVYGHSYNRISIRNQKTCWGSCSRKGNLNFNYKILFLPERAQDYVIAHELCHLKEFNHSKRFWELVARTSPDYVEIRKELKRSGMRGIGAVAGVGSGVGSGAGVGSQAGFPSTPPPASPAGARAS